MAETIKDSKEGNRNKHLKKLITYRIKLKLGNEYLGKGIKIFHYITYYSAFSPFF